MFLRKGFPAVAKTNSFVGKFLLTKKPNCVLTMKTPKLVQIVITDDFDTTKHRDERIIFDVYRSVGRAIVFLQELGISLNTQTLYQLWKHADHSKVQMSFRINTDYHEKLMRLCPNNKRLPLNEALEHESAHIGIVPIMD